MALVAQYLALTQQHIAEYGENTIVLMQVGSFYEMYGQCDSTTGEIRGSRIVDVASICNMNFADKKASTIEGTSIKMAGFPDYQIDKYLQKIIDAGYTVPLYTQVDSTANARTKDHILAGVYSLGTHFSTESTRLSNSACCIWVEHTTKYIVVGAANIDIYTGAVNVFQSQEKRNEVDHTAFDDVFRFVSIYNPVEGIVIAGETTMAVVCAGLDGKVLHKIFNNSSGSHRVKNCEKQTYQREIMIKFYGDGATAWVDDIDAVAMQALCYLLEFVQCHNPHLINGLAEPSVENHTTRLHLANQTLKQLNIIDDGQTKSGKLSCVANMLNECITPMARREFIQLLLNPSHDAAVLAHEYHMIERTLASPDIEAIRIQLTGIKDLERWQRAAAIKKATPKSVCGLYSSLVIIGNIVRNASNGDSVIHDISADNAKATASAIADNAKATASAIAATAIAIQCSDICRFITHTIDLHAAANIDSNFDANFIRSGISAVLDTHANALCVSEAKLEAIRIYLNGLITARDAKKNKGKGTVAAVDSVKIHETDKSNLGLVATDRRCSLLCDALPMTETEINLQTAAAHPFIFKVSKQRFRFEKQAATNSYIIDDQLAELSSAIVIARSRMKELIADAFTEFMNRLMQFQSTLGAVIAFITRLDVLYTKATIAKKYRYCKPTLIMDSPASVTAKQLRHCLIERFQSDELYVPNDVALSAGGILLYGTNAVGKTSLIRALGIAIIMAQAGLYVPCSEFRFHPYKRLFTRIIGNDNIFRGLSTFSVEMSELRTILRYMDADSLILGDELCSGTETMSAISIFVAGIRSMCACRSSFIFATHLHEIVHYNEILELLSEGVLVTRHMAVRYDASKNRLVYNRKMEPGSGSSMYGLEVCKYIGLPADFLDAAYKIREQHAPNGDGTSVLDLRTSRYNTRKLTGVMCENCGKRPGIEVHHVNHQAWADESDGFITSDDGSVFHKNTLANLRTLCEKCHAKEHA